MKKLRTIAVGAAVLVATMVVLATPVYGLGTLTAEERCMLVDEHVSTVINRMHDISVRREKAYADAAMRTANQLKAAQNAGYDATQLEADYKALQADIAVFHDDRLKLEADLTNVLSVAPTECGSGTGAFATALQTARNALPPLRADDVKIRVDIRQKLIPDIRAYAAWLKNNAGATTSQ